MLQAVQEIPSGQAAPLVRFVAVSASGLAAMTAVQQAALAEVCAGCTTACAASIASSHSTLHLPLLGSPAPASRTQRTSGVLRPHYSRY